MAAHSSTFFGFGSNHPVSTLALAGAPGSAATITVGGTVSVPVGAVPFMYLALTSSHDSAASGVYAEGSWDNGTTWRQTTNASQYLTASGFSLFQAPVVAPLMRWRYVNSASVITTWDGCTYYGVDMVKV
jgi:hypothetical protein